MACSDDKNILDILLVKRTDLIHIRRD